MDEIAEGARKLIPSINLRSVIATFAGLRPMGNARSLNLAVDYHNDFVIEIPRQVQGLVNLGGIESPGLTSAPAIAEMVVALLKDAGETLIEKKTGILFALPDRDSGTCHMWSARHCARAILPMGG